MRKLLPNWLKSFLRLFYYRQQRQKIIREFSIRRKQNNLIKTLYSGNIERLIVFMVPGADFFTGADKISGGILSIASLYEETRKLDSIHGADVLMCTCPKDHLLFRHTQFDNHIPVFRFSQLAMYFRNLKSLIIHVPELLVVHFHKNSRKYANFFLKTGHVHLNILNQNIEKMPNPAFVRDLLKSSRYDLLTQTTAHEKYTTASMRQKYGIPVHRFSTFCSPEKYYYTELRDKNDLLIVSPDPHPDRTAVLRKIKKELPRLRILEIKGLRYPEYLAIVEKAKFALTFGEGLDFYFVDTVFSGGVGLAIYNSRFFTPSFKGVTGVYPSRDSLKGTIAIDLERLLSDVSFYRDVNRQQYKECKSLYKFENYVRNLKEFYLGEYTFK